MTLIDQIADGSGGFLTFALTPPRSSTMGDRAQEIADATLDHLRPLYPRPELRTWIERQDPARVATVLVGAASRDASRLRRLPRRRRCAVKPTRNFWQGASQYLNVTAGATTNICDCSRSKTPAADSS